MRESYDRIAPDYTERIAGELAEKPFDREILDRFAATLEGRGPVCDIGCGPGHVARYLFERGVDVFGLDFSAGMLREARRRNQGMQFIEGDMTALPLNDESLAGIVAFYSICNVRHDLLGRVFTEMHRTLRPNGPLLLAFHIGDWTESIDELWGHSVSMDFYGYQPAMIASLMSEVGFLIQEAQERAPYAPEVEYQSYRAYILARKAPV